MSSSIGSELPLQQSSTHTASGEPRLWNWISEAKRRRTLFWVVVAVLGFVQTWSHRLLVDHDGVAYLDIAENYARGAWASALNGYYSPLYSWLMAVPLYLLKVPRPWQSTMLHLVNFSGYLCAFASFQFFLAQWLQARQQTSDPENRSAGLSESAWHILGFALFLYSTLFMANLSGSSGKGDGSTPDIFVMVFVFLASAFLMRIWSARARLWHYCAFGAVLGLGYLAKAAMFPISFVFLAAAALLSLRQRRAAFFLAPICFGLIAGPWILALSHASGRFTFGDAGILNFRWEVADRANPGEWGGQTEEQENLLHPPRRLWTEPPVYEFAAPVSGTFPLWYGSSYWLEGTKYHFSRAGQMRVIREGYNNYRAMLDNQKEYLALLFFLILLQGANFRYFKSFLDHWVLWLPPSGALGLYLLVRVEPRYVAPFLVLFWIGLFAAVKFPTIGKAQQFAQWGVLAAVLATSVNFLHEGLADFHAVLRNARDEQSEVADGLRRLGILEGQSLATIGIPRDSFYWARLAGVRVISEIPTPDVNQYWFAPPATQEGVRSIFTHTGAVAIVTDVMPLAEKFPQSSIPICHPGWEQIGNTSYFFFSLRTASPISSAKVAGSFLPAIQLPARVPSRAKGAQGATHLWMQ